MRNTNSNNIWIQKKNSNLFTLTQIFEDGHMEDGPKEEFKFYK